MTIAWSLEFNVNGTKNYSSVCSDAELTQGRNMIKSCYFLCMTGPIFPVTTEVDCFLSVAIIVLLITRFHLATRFLSSVSILYCSSLLNQWSLATLLGDNFCCCFLKIFVVIFSAIFSGFLLLVCFGHWNSKCLFSICPVTLIICLVCLLCILYLPDLVCWSLCWSLRMISIWDWVWPTLLVSSLFNMPSLALHTRRKRKDDRNLQENHLISAAFPLCSLPVKIPISGVFCKAFHEDAAIKST